MGRDSYFGFVVLSKDEDEPSRHRSDFDLPQVILYLRATGLAVVRKLGHFGFGSYLQNHRNQKRKQTAAKIKRGKRCSKLGAAIIS